METEWSEQTKTSGRVTPQTLGQTSTVAVIRWGTLYRIIRVVDVFYKRACFVFGVQEPCEREGPSGIVTKVLIKGVMFDVQSWVLRSQCTIPPRGPRAVSVDRECMSLMGGYWKRHIDWKTCKGWRKRCRQSRMVILSRRSGYMEYRAVHWQSPCVGNLVRVQGMFVVGIIHSIAKCICVVHMSGIVLHVHRTCLILV